MKRYTATKGKWKRCLRLTIIPSNPKLISSSCYSSSTQPAMALASFLGRVLFAFVFILSAYQQLNEYGVDGGPAAMYLRPKFDVFIHRVQSHVGLQVPEIEIKHLVATAIVLKGIGGVLFIFGSSLGAYLLLLHQMIVTPILYNFYEYDNKEREFTQLFTRFTENMALCGALLFFIGMKYSTRRKQHKKQANKTKAV